MTEPQVIAERYLVIRPLGRGAFGTTLLARDTNSGGQVAIKVLHPRSAADWKAYELFEREAAVLGDLRHPGIPAVHTAMRAQWDGAECACLIMDYIEGASLADVIGERRHRGAEDVETLFLRLLDVLEYLHSRVPPVLHRDVKPSNVILRPDGTVALVDFGSVRNAFRRPEESGSTVAGTYGYMPYEQYMGQASPASDLYALAATFLHVVTGRPPAEFMTQAGRIEVPRTLSCGEPLRGVLVKLLSPAPADRFQSAAEVRVAMSRGGGLALLDVHHAVTPALLRPPPRGLDGDTAALYRRASYSPWAMMDPETHPDAGTTLGDYLLIGFFSVLTLGVLPAVFVSRWVSRRRRLRPFFVRGLAATARVLDVHVEEIEFAAKLARVRYEFQADGRRHVGVDRVHPVGTELAILYETGGDYDSVIVGAA